MPGEIAMSEHPQQRQRSEQKHQVHDKTHNGEWTVQVNI